MKKTTLLIPVLLGLFVSACGGCDDEPLPPPQTPTEQVDMTPEVDMAMVDMQMPPVDMRPPVWPAYVTVSADPQSTLYRPTVSVTLDAQVVGTNEMPWTSGELAWSVSPEGGAVQVPMKPGRWTLEKEGEVVITACATDRGFEGQEICGSWKGFVDAGSPTIVITKPSPGEQLDGMGDVAIEGQVTDSNGDPFVLVNGKRVMLDGEGKFATSMTPRFGINHVEVIASDNLQKLPSVSALDVQWAPVWTGAIASPQEVGVSFDDGLVLDLGQDFFDDRQRYRTTLEGKTLTKDLADILLLLLERVDLTTLIPNPVSNTDSFKLTISDVDLGKPDLSISITPEGLEIFINSEDMLIRTDGSLTLAQETLGLLGSIKAGVSVVAQVTVDKASPEEAFKVEIKTLGVAIEEAKPKFMDVRTDALFTLAQSALRTQIETVLVDALKTSFIDTVPQLLAQTLTSLEDALKLQQFSVDLSAIEKGQLDLELRGKILSFEKEELRSMQAQVQTALVAKLASGKPAAKGVGLTTEADKFPPFVQGGRVQLGLRLGLINGLLNGLWDGGLLTLDATSLIPDDLKASIKSAKTQGKLPPVASAPQNGEPFDLIITLGQFELEVDAPLTRQKVRYGVSLAAGANFTVQNNEVKLTISEQPDLKVWVIEVDDGQRARLGSDQLRSLVLENLWPGIKTSLGEGVNLKLPDIPLDSLTQYAPELAKLKLSFEQVQRVSVRDGFVVLDVTLQGVLSP